MNIHHNSSADNVHNSISALGRYTAQPNHRLGNTFKQVLGIAEAAVGKAASIAGVDGDYAGILQQQMEMQRQMMMVSMISNTERTRHETNMVGVRNMRVS